MTAKHSADLTGVSETALMTLQVRASEARRPDGIIDDPMAVHLVDSIDVDFGKFGTFDFREAHLGVWEGHRHTDEADWRRCVFKRSLTPAEQLVSGSAWDLHFKRGTPFRVEFHASGAFHAPDYPGDFTWDITDGVVVVHWGKYGTFDLDKIDVKRKALSGAKRGDPGNWRKLEFVKALPCYLPADPLE